MDVEKIEEIRSKILTSFNNCLSELVDCEILSSDCIPEGIKPHTRSIAWIAEQVIIQGIRKHIDQTSFEYLQNEESDTALNDCRAKIGNDEILINIKVTTATKRTKNDINKAYKLYKLFVDKPDTLLFYVIMKMKFTSNQVELVNDPPTVFYIPYIKSIYVNPSNHHLQADYYDTPVVRSVKEFTDEIIKQIKEKNLPEK